MSSPKQHLTEKWIELEPECDYGWYGLIDETLAEIRETIQADPDEDLSELEITKIGNWKGYLKFWIQEPYPMDIRGILEHAKLKSLWTCETCGEDGRVRESKQVVRCRDCAMEQQLRLEKEEMN